MALFEAEGTAPLKPPPPSRHRWAWLLQRVFAVDVMTCPDCEGAMKVVAIAKDPGEVRALVGKLERSRAPPSAPQLEFDFVAA